MEVDVIVDVDAGSVVVRSCVEVSPGRTVERVIVEAGNIVS